MVPKIRDLINQSEKILLTTHMNPDGDGLGSELALFRQLREGGKEVRIVNNDPIPERYRFLDPEGESEVFDRSRDLPFIQDCDLIFVLDNSSMERMGKLAAPMQSSSAKKICIDHHLIPSGPGTAGNNGIWDILWNMEEASATGELIYELIMALGGPMTHGKAEPLYVSLVTDTGNFRFSKTGPKAHQVAAALLACGVNPVRVYQEIFERSSTAFMRLLGYALTHFHQECEDRLVWVTMDRRKIEEFSAQEEDTSEMVNSFFQIHRVRVALLFKELSDGKTKVSLRSKGDFDMNRLAVHFGGGGHRNASGIVLDDTLNDGTERVLREARKLF
ncbi:MAG: bifunctional oligoribonuclease/PAP phosphatase NrnA [Acidobacteria bacterium]|nr:bifunctional oligoribonuclease/PAP phosphatase NrnA [Acidobacteriota bacterium]